MMFRSSTPGVARKQADLAQVRAPQGTSEEAAILDNGAVRVVVLPRLGGRIWELTDVLRERQWIWHRPGAALVQLPGGASYDDNWAGGWEELFPNDAPGTLEGRMLHDHGVWWSAAWRVLALSDAEGPRLRIGADFPEYSVICEKEIFLPTGRGECIVSYWIRNQGESTLPFLFKQHLPVALRADSRLLLPGGRVTPVDPSFGNLLPGPGPYAWPNAAGVDLSTVLPVSCKAREFVYVSELPEAWCGVVDRGSGAHLTMHFDAALVPYVWLFMSYGGWRDCHTVVLEPCTNMPKDLHEAVRLRQSACLAPEATFSTRVAVQLGSV